MEFEINLPPPPPHTLPDKITSGIKWNEVNYVLTVKDGVGKLSIHYLNTLEQLEAKKIELLFDPSLTILSTRDFTNQA